MNTSNYLKSLFPVSPVKPPSSSVAPANSVVPWQWALRWAGAEVVLGGRIPEKAERRLAKIQSHGGTGYFVPVDVTSRESLHHLLDTVLERSGQVDILINGAGTNSPTLFCDITEEEYARIMDTNLAAIFRACQVFGKYFVESCRPASIINLGSISGLSPLSRVFTYSASKAAVHNLTRNLAREWADKDIRVNTLVPGFFPADKTARCSISPPASTSSAKPPLPVSATRKNSSGPRCSFAAPVAGSFITGIEIYCHGGFHAMTI